MDGYAVSAAKTGDVFRVIGEAAAGHRFNGIVGHGEAVRIFTGAPVPDGAASDRPDAPWCHAGGATDDWIGNEMLLWLWYSAEAGDGIAVTLDGGERVEAEIVFDGPIELECPRGVMGKVAIKAHEEGVAASRTAEAREAIRIGKQPRRAGLMISDGEQAWRLTLQADRWLISGGELPKDETDDELDPRELVEVRVERSRRLPVPPHRHCAGAAGAFSAAFLCAGQSFAAQPIEQHRRRSNAINAPVFAVQTQLDGIHAPALPQTLYTRPQILCPFAVSATDHREASCRGRC